MKYPAQTWQVGYQPGENLSHLGDIEFAAPLDSNAPIAKRRVGTVQEPRSQLAVQNFMHVRGQQRCSISVYQQARYFLAKELYYQNMQIIFVDPLDGVNEIYSII